MQNNISKHSSSDDLIDIQIEESLVRETLMLIDSSNCKEDLFTLLCFCAALVLSIIIGMLGPPVENYTDSLAIISHDKIDETFVFPFRDFKKTMRNAQIEVFFSKKVGEQSPNVIPVTFSYNVNCYSDKQTIKTEHKTVKGAELNFAENEKDSSHFYLFSTSIIDFNKLVLDIDINDIDKSIGSITARLVTGSEQHTYFQLYVRTAYSIFILIFVIAFLTKLFGLSMKYWHLEQKLTVPLLFLTALNDNPMYFANIYFPSQLFVIFNRLIQAAYQAYFIFFILTLFDSLRYKNRKTDACFFGPKIALCFLLFIVSVIHGVYDDTNIFSDNLKKNDTMGTRLTWLELSFTIILYILSFISIVRAMFQIDITEKYKLKIYIVSSITAMMFLFLVDIIERFSTKASKSSIDFVTKFSVKNIFVMLMTYFHWPYELFNDQTYDESGTSNRAQNDFFLNGE